jgi:hypothetical protein
MRPPAHPRRGTLGDVDEPVNPSVRGIALFFGHAEPLEALRVLMESRGLRQRDLIPVFGSSSVASDVLNEKRSLSKMHSA